MKISEVIQKLQKHKEKYGDVEVSMEIETEEAGIKGVIPDTGKFGGKYHAEIKLIDWKPDWKE